MAVTFNLWNVFESFNGVLREAIVAASGEFSICECFDIISMQSCCVLLVGFLLDYLKLCCGEIKYNGIQLNGMREGKGRIHGNSCNDIKGSPQECLLENNRRPLNDS